MQKPDPHEVWYIPHGFMFSCFYNVKVYREMRGKTLGILRSGGEFWTPKSRSKS